MPYNEEDEQDPFEVEDAQELKKKLERPGAFAGYDAEEARQWHERWVLKQQQALEKTPKIVLATKKRLPEIRQELVEKFQLILLWLVFCPVCRAMIPQRPNETVRSWAAVRRCNACVTGDRTASGIKYCRQCGERKSIAEYTAENPGSDKTSLRNGWKTWARCKSCVPFTKEAERLARKLATEAVIFLAKR